MALRGSWLQLLVFLPILGIFLIEIQIQRLQNQPVYAPRSERGFDLDIGQESTRDHEIRQPLPVVLYNRIPKTGSTTFTNLIYDSCKKNKIYSVHINVTKNSHLMSLQDQYSLVHNITYWDKMRPVFYHGHMAYLNFKHFGSPVTPLYINIIRDPLERLVSYYYFLRYGDNYRKGLKRARQGDTTTFDECVKKRRMDCSVEKMWLQIPFFCGQNVECWKPGSEWALQEAKNNLINNYMVVGMTEQLEDFIVVLEASLPRMFKGIVDMYREGSKSHIRKTLHKEAPSEETVNYFQNTKVWKMEMELYLFAKEQFEFIKQQSTTVDSKGRLVPIPRRFRYEKIHGPSGVIL